MASKKRNGKPPTEVDDDVDSETGEVRTPADEARDYARGPVVTKEVERYLPVKLTTAEHRAKSEQLARTVDDIDGVKARKKVAAEKFKDEESTLMGVQSRLAKEVETGFEDRRVVCQWQDDFARKTKRLYREDTGEVVETRPMTPGEYQQRLDV